MKGDKLVIEKEHIQAAGCIKDLVLPDITKNQGKYIVTIAGESGSGKSEVAAVLAKLFLEEKNIRSIIIQQDDYFVYPPKTNARMRRMDINHVGVSEVQLELLDQHLKEIKDGKDKIERPLVIFDEDRITKETINLKGIKAVIVEGTYTTLLRNVHRHIFINRTYLDTKKSRRQRAREKQDEFLEKILEIEHKIISSHKSQADIIITHDYELHPIIPA